MSITEQCASAAKRNALSELKTLLTGSPGADVLNHIVPGTGMTMLGNALNRGNEAASGVIDFLLDQEHIDVDKFDAANYRQSRSRRNGDLKSFVKRSPLHCAIECGHFEYVERICEHGKNEQNYGELLKARLLTRFSKNYFTPFLNAVKCGKVKIYKYLLELGKAHGMDLALDVMPDDLSDEKNALEIAVKNGYYRTSKFLLDQHAWEYLRKTDHAACSDITSEQHPMRVALVNSHDKLAKLLQKCGSPMPDNLPGTVTINKFKKRYRWQIPQVADEKTLKKHKSWIEDVCMICQMNFGMGRSFCYLDGCACKITDTPAMYHVGCITKWLNQKGSTCPVCSQHYKQFNVLKT